MPGGIIAEKFGGKYSLGVGILSTAIFTLLTPWVVGFGDYKWLIALRVLEGLGEVNKCYRDSSFCKMGKGAIDAMSNNLTGYYISSSKCDVRKMGASLRTSQNWYASICWWTNRFVFFNSW